MANRHGISYWDAAILAAARMLECDAVYSEDLNEGQSYDGVLVPRPAIFDKYKKVYNQGIL